MVFEIWNEPNFRPSTWLEARTHTTVSEDEVDSETVFSEPEEAAD